jgi:LysM repeat protein
VKRGDTLIGIATTYNSTVQAIKDFNGLTSNSLKIGQELKIP